MNIYEQEDTELGLPPDEELLGAFGGLSVKLSQPGTFNILSVHTEDEQGGLILYNSALSGETTLRALIERRHGVSLTGHFHGKIVAPPHSIQLQSARQRAAREVRSSVFHLNCAASDAGGHPMWEKCGHEFQYKGTLTPWELHLRVGPVSKAQKQAEVEAQAQALADSRAKRIKRPVEVKRPRRPRKIEGWPTPIPPDLSTDRPTHIIQVEVGHHRPGTVLVPFSEDLHIRGPMGGFLAGEITPIPGWALAVLEGVAEAEKAAMDENMARRKARHAAEKVWKTIKARELLAALGGELGPKTGNTDPPKG
jgi:hypothetical protein